MPALCRARLFLPPGADGVLHTANMNTENRLFLAALFPGADVRAMEKAQMLAALEARFGADLLEEAVSGLARRSPHLSAQRVVTPGQGKLFLLLALGLVAGFCLAPILVLGILFVSLSCCFAAAALFRAWLALLYKRDAALPAPATRDGNLPVYTVLVPLYREAAALPGLARALMALEYPADRLDIKLVVEADDAETAEAARALGPAFEIVAVPALGPRTKPKACNYALGAARGEYLVIYDAEDRPEPDQLLKAVGMFRAAPRRTACLQARLNFHNARANWVVS